LSPGCTKPPGRASPYSRVLSLLVDPLAKRRTIHADPSVLPLAPSYASKGVPTPRREHS
jgi:hypothetical protein